MITWPSMIDEHHDMERFTNDNQHIILSSDENRLKLLGEIFANKTSRQIITCLIDKEMTATQISENMNLKMNLVLYHLNKMTELGIISISSMTKNSRGHNIKHYTAKKAVLIFSKKAKVKAAKSKMLHDALRRVTKFSAIGMTGVLTWLVTSATMQGNKIVDSAFDAGLKYPRPTLPPYMMPIEAQSGSLPEFVMPIMFAAVVALSILIIDRIVISKIRLFQ